MALSRSMRLTPVQLCPTYCDRLAASSPGPCEPRRSVTLMPPHAKLIRGYSNLITLTCFAR
eukprot:5331513-Prymnesium_polylepis.1